jgi:ABC-2 type transport system permease protein
VFGVGVTVTVAFAQAFLAVAMALLGLVFMICYHFLIGILTFKYTEIDFLMHVQGSIIAFVTGSLVPLSLLPDAALNVLRLLPFTHVVFTPVMLLCGQIDIVEGLFSLVIIALWTLAMFAIGQYAYRHLRVKYDGVVI